MTNFDDKRQEVINGIKQLVVNWRICYRKMLLGDERDDFLLSEFQEEVERYIPAFYIAWKRGEISKEEYQELVGHWENEVAEFELEMRRYRHGLRGQMRRAWREICQRYKWLTFMKDGKK